MPPRSRKPSRRSSSCSGHVLVVAGQDDEVVAPREGLRRRHPVEVLVGEEVGAAPRLPEPAQERQVVAAEERRQAVAHVRTVEPRALAPVGRVPAVAPPVPVPVAQVVRLPRARREDDGDAWARRRRRADDQRRVDDRPASCSDPGGVDARIPRADPQPQRPPAQRRRAGDDLLRRRIDDVDRRAARRVVDDERHRVAGLCALLREARRRAADPDHRARQPRPVGGPADPELRDVRPGLASRRGTPDDRGQPGPRPSALAVDDARPGLALEDEELELRGAVEAQAERGAAAGPVDARRDRERPARRPRGRRAAGAGVDQREARRPSLRRRRARDRRQRRQHGDDHHRPHLVTDGTTAAGRPRPPSRLSPCRSGSGSGRS